jgi:signal transduction histidine kinase
MRATLSLIFFAILAAFVAGYLALQFRTAPDVPSLAEIATARQELVKKLSPRLQFRLTDVYPDSGHAELLDPSAHLPRSARYDYAEISALYRYANACDAKLLPSRRPSASLSKAWSWHRYLCRAIPELPSDFFESPPLIHPSGSSFAYLAAHSGLETFASPEWIHAHRGLLHVAELASLPPQELDPARRELSKLDRAGQSAVALGAALAMTDDSVLIRSSSTPRFIDADPVYEVYDLALVTRFLGARPVSLMRADPLKGCFYKEGNACWSLNAERIYRTARLPSMILLAATGLLVTLLSWVLLKRMNEQRLEEERKKFALQALTHELRTPISSLRLSAETLRKGFDQLAPDSQDAFLRICDDLQRLQKLTEASRQYLGALGRGELVALKPQTIPSLSDFLQSIAEPYGAEIALHGPDGAFTADGYWLGMCIKNLLENAIFHGKPPVSLSASLTGSHLWISVADAGRCEFGTLARMTAHYAKRPGSPGLGLGLSLIVRIVAEMGGKIEFSKDPTAFRLTIPNGARA